MPTLRVTSVLFLVGGCVAACSSNDATPALYGDLRNTGSANGPASTSGGAVTGGSATDGASQGTGGAASGAATGSGIAADSAASGTTATSGGVANGGSGAVTGGNGTGGAATDSVATGGTTSGGEATSSTSGATITSGASTTGASPTDPNCFPPVSDFAARDGGFGAAEREVVQIGSGDSVSLFRPGDEKFAQAGCKYPLLVWGNGSTNTVDIWAGHLSRAATFGFVIVAPEQTQVNAGHMNDGLDYVIALSQDPSSPYYDRVDTTKLGATGYSLGGAGAMGVASNERIKATFIWDSFGNCSSLHGPLGTIVASDGLGSLDLIDSCPPQSFGMQAEGTNHTSILGYPGGFAGPGGSTPYAQEGYVAWFRWRFMGDSAAEALFVGASCGFCTREGMTTRKNGID